MNRAWQKFKKQFEENPVGTVFVMAVAASAAVKVYDAYSQGQSRKAYARHAELRARGL